MDPKELADKLEALDVEAFASLLQLESSHDDAPGASQKTNSRCASICRSARI
jgi:hypothetical protein